MYIIDSMVYINNVIVSMEYVITEDFGVEHESGTWSGIIRMVINKVLLLLLQLHHHHHQSSSSII